MLALESVAAMAGGKPDFGALLQFAISWHLFPTYPSGTAFGNGCKARVMELICSGKIPSTPPGQIQCSVTQVLQILGKY